MGEKTWHCYVGPEGGMPQLSIFGPEVQLALKFVGKCYKKNLLEELPVNDIKFLLGLTFYFILVSLTTKFYSNWRARQPNFTLFWCP